MVRVLFPGPETAPISKPVRCRLPDSIARRRCSAYTYAHTRTHTRRQAPSRENLARANSEWGSAQQSNAEFLESEGTSPLAATPRQLTLLSFLRSYSCALPVSYRRLARACMGGARCCVDRGSHDESKSRPLERWHGRFRSCVSRSVDVPASSTAADG